jgi:cupin fold WbuC family metalloprotein
VKTITGDTIDHLIARAQSSPRRRLNLNLHDDLADPVQRFLNAGEPDTYTRPHRHAPGRWELFVALRGEAEIVGFTDDGAVASRTRLNAKKNSIVEIPGGSWHSVVYLLPGTVLFELKPGPYTPETDKEYSPWAPPETDAAAQDCARWLASAPAGSRWTAGPP